MNTLTPISVVIPTYNGQRLLEKHLPAVAKILDEGDEIIIADDASTDDTRAWVESQQAEFARRGIELKHVRSATNQRFAATCNMGIDAARHAHVFLLNNDVSPLTPNIKAKLLQWFDDPDVFAVGCAEVQSDEPNAQKSGRGTGGFQRGLLVHWYDPNQEIHQTLWAAGGSMMLDRAKFQEIKGFDTLFYPAYEEDRDLSYRALKHGWKVWFEPQAIVHHQHETTNQSVFGKRNMEFLSWKNQYLIVWKNVTDLPFILQHLAWLPYHLTVSTVRSGGASLIGFGMALQQLAQALRQRSAVKKLWKLTDRAVLTR